ncbi:MAG: T9SS type A sorting domain-containing protein [Chitinophagales bacterium]
MKNISLIALLMLVLFHAHNAQEWLRPLDFTAPDQSNARLSTTEIFQNSINKNLNCENCLAKKQADNAYPWDTVLCFKWNEDDWLYRDMRILTFDGQGNVAEELSIRFDEFGWGKYITYIYEYDSDGNMTYYLSQRKNGGSWENDMQSINEYDAGGNLTNAVRQSWENDRWENHSRQIYEYDNQGNLASGYYQRWGNSKWNNYSKSTFSYNKDNLRDTTYSYSWDGNKWKLRSKSITEYDDNENVVYRLSQIWEDSIWVDNSRTISTYNSANQKTRYTSQFWNGVFWANDDRAIYTYTPAGKRTKILYQEGDGLYWDNDEQIIYMHDTVQNSGTQYINVAISQYWEGMAWKNASRNISTVNSEGTFREYITQYWENNTWENQEKCQYGNIGLPEGIVIPQPEIDIKVSVYPNPFIESTTFSLEGIYQIREPAELRIYNLLGQEVERESITQNRYVFSREALSSGIYIYKIRVAGKLVASGKLVAE